MKYEIIRSLIIEAMERANINPYGLTLYNTKRGIAVAFISAFGESAKDCFGYNENITHIIELNEEEYKKIEEKIWFFRRNYCKTKKAMI